MPKDGSKNIDLTTYIPPEIDERQLQGIALWKEGEDLFDWMYKQTGHMLNKLIVMAHTAKSENVKLEAIKEYLARPLPKSNIIDLTRKEESPIDRMSKEAAKRYVEAIVKGEDPKQITEGDKEGGESA